MARKFDELISKLLDCLLLFLSLVENLIILYSTSYSGIWQLQIVLPKANRIYVSGFNYFLGWIHFLGILIYLITKFRETRKMAQRLKEQLKITYPEKNPSTIALYEKLLENFAHTKFL